ncbi:MAG TPA: alpha/beta hydrolase [Vicinamibacterales bacterium]|nr:alpha/beta hydrolase [Vicinamibacterales bacterium]
MNRRFIGLLIVLLTTASAASAATVDGATIHWSSQGSGRQTLILVHGWTCDETSWKEQVPALSKSYRVITLDLPGHGKSGMPKTFSMEVFARAIEAVRVEAKVERAVLAGHSMGTPVIRKYALMHPDRVSALVIVDGLIQLPAAGIQPGQPGRGPLPVVNPAAREAMVKGMFGPATTPALQQHILKMMMGAPEATAQGAMNATWDQSQLSDQKITVPVLAVFAGTRALATEQAVKTLYPNAEYFTIPETAHFLMMEKPGEFNRMLSTFVDKLR